MALTKQINDTEASGGFPGDKWHQLDKSTIKTSGLANELLFSGKYLNIDKQMEPQNWYRKFTGSDSVYLYTDYD